MPEDLQRTDIDHNKNHGNSRGAMTFSEMATTEAKGEMQQ
jgi:hypothetical protein